MLGRIRTALPFPALVESPSRRRRRGRARGLRAAARPASPSRSRSRSGTPRSCWTSRRRRRRRRPEQRRQAGHRGLQGERRRRGRSPRRSTGSTSRASTGIIEARAPDRPVPTPCADRRLVRPRRRRAPARSASASPTARTSTLSNNHVFAGINSASIGDPIIQPGDATTASDPADRIGTLHAYQEIKFDGSDNTMDAALAATTVANTGTATPSDGYGMPSPVTAQASLGQGVQKYGRTTGFQLGTVAGTNVSVDVCYLVIFEFCSRRRGSSARSPSAPAPSARPATPAR